MSAPTSRSVIGAGTGGAPWWSATWPAGISSRPSTTPRARRSAPGARAWRCRSREEDHAMVKIRKLVTVVEEINSDGGREARRPLRKAAAVAVIENPFAGRVVDDLTPLIDAGGG